MNSSDGVVALDLPAREGSERGASIAEEFGVLGGHWVPLAEVSRQLGIPASSMRRYLEHHGGFLDVSRLGKRTLVARGSVATLEVIRTLYDSGATVSEVDDELRRRHGPRPPPAAWADDALDDGAAAPEPTAVHAPDVTREIRALRADIAVLAEALAAARAAQVERDALMRQILAALVELVSTQDNERRLAEEERDRTAARAQQMAQRGINELLSMARKRRWAL